MGKTTITVKINKQAIARLKSQINEAFAEVTTALDKEFEDTIEDPYAFASEGFTNWDIVDTGRLRDSQMVTAESNSKKATAYWIWDPVDPETQRHYAGDVFAGFMSFSGNWIPGRDWPNKAVERLNPLQVFANALKRQQI